MKNINASVGILTLNSGKTLTRCLESIKEFDEIIICDGNSTDNTLDIARSYDCKIIPQYKSSKKNLKAKDKAKLRNKTITAAKYDWYFWLDSDDYASPELMENIRSICNQKNPKHLFWQVQCLLKINDHIIRYSASYPDLRILFFNKKTQAKFSKPEHESIKFDKTKYKAGQLKGHVYLCWDKERIGKAYWRNAGPQLEKEVKFHLNKPWSDYWRWTVWFNLKNMARYLIKPIFIYAKYGFKDSMPPRVEFYRFLYHTKLMTKVTMLRVTGKK